MAKETTYTNLRQNLATILDEVIEDQEAVIVRRRGTRDVALLPAQELAGLLETAHLLRSSKNARRLLEALQGSIQGQGRGMSMAEVRREFFDAPES